MIQLVLVTPEIPANTGNIVRLCAATGVPLHLVEPLGFSWDDRVLKRAGLDYWELCDIQRHLTFDEVIKRACDSRLLFLTAHAKRSFFEARILPGDFLVLGPESEGLSRDFLARYDRAGAARCAA
jgi:tRNA (cytidine/uridine-2'-O-)-methyltransferase